ncbi:DUF4433 domain-containing protein [Mariniblastus sp.]|nr:DUF4433 domain-containing protein [Mariniblastus sp.]
MTIQTAERPIYHITHVDTLASIIADGCLWSDHEIRQRDNERVVIGYDTIKQRRLEKNRVSCYAQTFVGQYVPFYFCPRSPMLYVINKKNLKLDYRGGQDRIVHLVSRIGLAVDAAGERPWAFSDGNAGASYPRYCDNLDEIDDYVNWDHVNAKFWMDPVVEDRKQAEFLVFESFPWHSIFGIGAINQTVANEVNSLLQNVDHKPEVIVKPSWYY